MNLEMHTFGVEGTLAGAGNGLKTLGMLLEKTIQDPSEPEIVYLDFSGVDVATASFLRECVLGFRDRIRERSSNYYVVVANANKTVLEELAVILGRSGNAMLVCDLRAGKPRDIRMIGNLDPKQKMTFELVKRLGETDASSLMKQKIENENKTVQTAWNNRLASLARLGLLIELSSGRAKRYRALLGEC